MPTAPTSPQRGPRAACGPWRRDRTVARKTLVLGTQHFTRRDLEQVRQAGETIHIRVLGLASIAEDVTPELALATIAAVEVLGAFRASQAVKAALRNRIV
jgi:hypothetical protein